MIAYRTLRASSAAAIVLAASAAVGQSLPAFPGADGAGKFATGGRGGIVYHVTKLNGAIDDPQRATPGTLVYGLTDANFPAGTRRTIVFDIGGVINLGRLPQPANNWDGNNNGWDTQSRLNIPSNVTIAGETAPGRGITITGGVIKIGGTNAIVRNLTVLPGYGNRNFYQPGAAAPAVNDYPDTYLYDAFDISGQNVILDHLTTAYATDETISANELANNLTVQYSNISQGQNYPQGDAEATGVRYSGHAYGSLLQAGTNAKVSVHHNLYAHQKGRLPRVGSEVGTGAYNDFRNNVFYNWYNTGGTGASGQPSFNNFVNNFWLAGDGGDDVTQANGPDGLPNTLDDIAQIVPRAGGTGVFSGNNSTGTRVHHAGNVKDINKDADPNDTVNLANSDFGSSTFFANPLWVGGEATYSGVTDTAVTAFDRVLNYTGARWWERDATVDTIDERLAQEVRAGTGKIVAWADDPFNPDPNEGAEWRALTNYPPVSRDAGFDTDQDGMPDGWERLHKLDPDVANNNGDFDDDGYTDVEEYLHDIAAFPAPKAILWNGGDGRYALQSNWDINWQPSRYDVVQVNAGTATIDAVGQQAGGLQIAAGATVRIAQGVDVMQRVGAVASNGKLDLTDNGLIVDYDASAGSPLAFIVAQIAAARNGGTWDGNGITTSLGNSVYSLGYADAATLLGLAPGEMGTFRGQPVDASSIIVLYTLAGDANLDRTVNIGDFSAMAANFNQEGKAWPDGDFTYDGVVGIADFAALARNFNATLAAPAAAAAAAAVPEPTVGIVIAMSLPLLMRCRL